MRKSIFFIIHELTVGGAEKVIVHIMNNILRDKYKVHLVIFKNIGELKKELRDDIIVHDLQVNSVKKGAISLYKLIKKHHPDIVFSGIAHVNLMLSTMIPFLPKDIKYIARETNTVSVENSDRPLFKMLYKLFYNNFNTIVCQSHYMKNDLINNFNINSKKIVVINNPVNIEKVNILGKQNTNLFDKKYFNLLAVGGFRKQKGFDLLLQVFSKLDEQFFLTIIGDGQERKNLEQLTKELKVDDRIKFLGFQSNPYPYMAQADLMVLSSRYEGFPNVVLEANACGTPVVAFDCPGGTSEIIENGVNGFLVECGVIEQLRIKIVKAIQINFKKEYLKHYMKKKYDIAKIIKEYYEVF